MRRKLELAAFAAVAVSTFLLVISRTAECKEVFDGYWWNKQSEEVKTAYVCGFVRGTNNVLDSLQELLDEETSSYGPSTYLVESVKKALEYAQAACAFDSFSIYEVSDGVEEFYKDFRNRRVTVDCAIIVVRMQLRERSEEFINLKTKRLRKEARE